jgi:hypothetical protein
VTLAISDESIGPAAREFGNNVRLLPRKGTYAAMMILLPFTQTAFSYFFRRSFRSNKLFNQLLRHALT